MSKTLIRIIPAPEGQPATIIHGKRRYEQYLSPQTRAELAGKIVGWYWAENVEGIWHIDASASQTDLDDYKRSLMRRARTVASSRYPASGGQERRKASVKPVTLSTFSWDDAG